jgi:thiol-disulfide isomerase/thioredoxin
VVIIAISLAVGIYFVSTANESTPLDKYDGVLVSTQHMTSLQAVSDQPYGPAATSAMQSDVTAYGGTQFISNGKPVVVYVGAEFCPYCAVERWPLIMALERFGNFTRLHYTTSANDEGDYASFTFVNSTYTSSYIAFRGYEEEDRSQAPLQTVPTNYSAAWSNFGNGFPFLDLGNTYVIKVSILPFPDIIGGKNWTAILNDISTSDSVGIQIREAANLITGVICKITQGAPAAVCSASPISTSTSSISAPTQASLTEIPTPSSAYVVSAIAPFPTVKRFG